MESYAVSQFTDSRVCAEVAELRTGIHRIGCPGSTMATLSGLSSSPRSFTSGTSPVMICPGAAAVRRSDSNVSSVVFMTE